MTVTGSAWIWCSGVVLEDDRGVIVIVGDCRVTVDSDCVIKKSNYH